MSGGYQHTTKPPLAEPKEREGRREGSEGRGWGGRGWPGIQLQPPYTSTLLFFLFLAGLPLHWAQTVLVPGSTSPGPLITTTTTGPSVISFPPPLPLKQPECIIYLSLCYCLGIMKAAAGNGDAKPPCAWFPWPVNEWNGEVRERERDWEGGKKITTSKALSRKSKHPATISSDLAHSYMR